MSCMIIFCIVTLNAYLYPSSVFVFLLNVIISVIIIIVRYQTSVDHLYAKVTDKYQKHDTLQKSNLSLDKTNKRSKSYCSFIMEEVFKKNKATLQNCPLFSH